MTNHVTNIISFKKVPIERVMQILEEIKNEKLGLGTIDFNKIIPMPDNIYQGNLSPADREKYGANNWLDWSMANWNTKWNGYEFAPYSKESIWSVMPEEKPVATHSAIRDLIANFAESGDEITHQEAREIFHNEADWGNIEQAPSNHTIVFDTAWSAPHPVLKQLSVLYPDVLIEHLWLEEVMGFSVGAREYKEGEIVYENMPNDGSKEAYELAAEIQGEKLSDLGYQLSEDGKTYDFVEEETEPENAMEKIKVVLVKPMKTPEIIEIDPGLKSMQMLVGGRIQETMPFEDSEVAMVSNEEGKIIGLELNRSIKDSRGEVYDIIAGSFFICGATGENFSSLSDEQAKHYCEKFKNPERFYQTNDRIKSVPVILNKNKDYER
jgi:hypothetical protein